MKCIYTNKGADPQAPYSQAMVTGISYLQQARSDCFLVVRNLPVIL